MAAGVAGSDRSPRRGVSRAVEAHRPPILLLDPCVVVNLYATRHLEAILDAVAYAPAIVDAVERESQFVFRGGDGDDARERERIDLAIPISNGVLSVIEATNKDELLTYIDLARELDDGEPLTVAVAIHRGHVVATDNRKAVRVLQRYNLMSMTSLDLIQEWAERQAVSSGILRAALSDLRLRGNYLPARRHPLKAWWDAALEGDDPGGKT